jgi:hypothetical protein
VSLSTLKQIRNGALQPASKNHLTAIGVKEILLVLGLSLDADISQTYALTSLLFGCGESCSELERGFEKRNLNLTNSGEIRTGPTAIFLQKTHEASKVFQPTTDLPSIIEYCNIFNFLKLTVTKPSERDPSRSAITRRMGNAASWGASNRKDDLKYW